MIERALTDKQKSVLEKLRKSRHTFLADAAEQKWKGGQSYCINTHVNISQRLRTAFNRANQQAIEVQADD